MKYLTVVIEGSLNFPISIGESFFGGKVIGFSKSNTPTHQSLFDSYSEPKSQDMKEQSQNYWDGKGEPEVGQFARVCNKSKYAVSESFKVFIGLNVEIINKFYFEDDLVVVIHNPKRGHKSISGFEKYLEPIKSEREIAIEEINRVIRSDHFVKSTAELLYDAGCRVEVK
jgi:hypothetical protein